MQLGEKRQRLFEDEHSRRLSRHIPSRVSELTYCANAIPAASGHLYGERLAQVCNIRKEVLVYGQGRRSAQLLLTPRSKPEVSKGFKVLDAPGLSKEAQSNLLSWSHSGLLIGLGDTIYQHDIATGSTQRVLYGNIVRQLVWAGSSRFISVVSQSSTNDGIVLADANQGHLRSIYLKGLTSTMCMQDKVMLVGFRDEKTVEFHDLRIKDSLVSTREVAASPSAVTLSGYTSVVGDVYGRVHIFDLRSMNSVAQTQLGPHSVTALAWRSPSEVIASSGSTLSVVSLGKVLAHQSIAAPVTSAIEAQSEVTCMLLSADGQLLTGHTNGNVSQYDLTSLEVNHVFGDTSDAAHAVICLTQDPRSHVIAVANKNETIRFYRPERKAEAASAPLSDIVDSLR